MPGAAAPAHHRVKAGVMDARWLALIVLTAARASMGFQFQSLASVAPLLVEDLGVTYAEVGFLIGLYICRAWSLPSPAASWAALRRQTRSS